MVSHTLTTSTLSLHLHLKKHTKLTPPTLSQSSPAGLPRDWEVRHSNSKNLPYYFNSVTKESRWDPPAGTDTDALKAFMAQHHTATSIRPDAQQTNSKEGKIRTAHLLIKHKDSRKPSSWREANITRTKEEAISNLLGHEARIRSGSVSLGQLAVTESDCSSARKRGDLGFFGRGDMQREFEHAAFALKPGEVSHVVETASGVHLIERNAFSLPENDRHRQGLAGDAYKSAAWEMEGFKYTPLETPDTFRLLRVFASDTQDPSLHCAIQHFELSEDLKIEGPKYTALSYVWGDHSATATVICDGKELKVTTLLRDGLDLAKGFGDDIFCNENTDDRENFEKEENITVEQSETLGILFKNTAAWTAFSAFYDSPWFQRIWVVQEVLPARKALAFRGEHSVDWRKVKEAAAWYTWKAVSVWDQYERTTDGIHLTTSMNLRWTLRLGSEYFPSLPDQKSRPVYKWSLENLIHRFHDRLATDSRDKIYALLGLSHEFYSAKGNPLFRPDYSKPVMEVFRDCTRAIFKPKYSNLGLLNSTLPPSPEPGWPSWVRDSQVRNPNAHISRLSYDQRLSTPQFEYLDTDPPNDPNILTVEGITLAKVIHVSAHNHTNQILVNGNLRREYENCKTIFESYNSHTDLIIYTPTNCSEPLNVAFAMALTADTVPASHVSAGTPLDQYAETLIPFIEIIMLLPHSTPEEIQIRIEAAKPYLDMGWKSDEFVSQVCTNYCGKRFFVAVNEDKMLFVGIGYENMRIGDYVSVIWGLNVACILRPKPSIIDANEPEKELGEEEAAAKSYTWIGEAYCHGAKEGLSRMEKGEDGRIQGVKLFLH
ncbi:MAG: hypothetical protein MMC33_009350 [Icmadophila ericetorum]|nr:hypothetical protein [Icmadophila ericetorum]